jgi:branched-chain amino acid transport system ATP-binding protein
MLKVDNINTYYGELQILKDVSLSVQTSELLAIFGANGHGKSTLLKTICGLLNPASGSIKFNEHEISHLGTFEIVNLGLVYVAEERHLFPEMTVLKNLNLGAFCRKARKKKSQNLETVFNLFPRLKDRRNQMASTLSGGEARMLAIGRGLMSSAKLIAIDEPSLGLAPNLRHMVFDKIAEIRNHGVGILLVEQNVAQALEIVDRIMLIEDGKIVFESDREKALNFDRIKKLYLGM